MIRLSPEKKYKRLASIFRAALAELARLRPEWRLGPWVANLAMTAGDPARHEWRAKSGFTKIRMGQVLVGFD